MTKGLKTLGISFGIINALIFSAFGTQEQAIFPEKINWKTHFLAKPDKYSPFYALTATRWHYSYNATIRGNDLHIHFKFSAGLDPNQSWVKLNQLKSEESKRKLLNHEQGHVNINFLLLKDGEQKIRFQHYTIRNYKKSIHDNANKISAYYSEMQKRYDTETKHGSDDANQKRWDDFIEKELKKYIR